MVLTAPKTWAGTGTEHQVFFHVHCSHLGGKTSVGHPEPKAQGREGQQYAVDMCWRWGECWEKFCDAWEAQFCTFRVSPDFSPGFSSRRGKRCLQESPQPVCHPGEAQTRRKPSITLVKEMKIPSNNSSKREGKARAGDPLWEGVFVWEDAEQLQGRGFSCAKESCWHSK